MRATACPSRHHDGLLLLQHQVTIEVARGVVRFGRQRGALVLQMLLLLLLLLFGLMAGYFLAQGGNLTSDLLAYSRRIRSRRSLPIS